MSGSEQPEAFSAAVVAVARKLVLESSATLTSTPASSSAGVTVAIGEPEQSAPLKRRTVVPAGAEPTTWAVVVGRRGGDGGAQLRGRRRRGVDLEVAGCGGLVRGRIGSSHAEGVEAIGEWGRGGVCIAP